MYRCRLCLKFKWSKPYGHVMLQTQEGDQMLKICEPCFQDLEQAYRSVNAENQGAVDEAAS